MKNQFDYYLQKGNKYKKIPNEKIDNIYYEYIGKSLRVSEQNTAFNEEKIKVYITDNVKRIPSQGRHVIAVVISEEIGKTPMYSGDIGLTFKCYGTTPDWEPNKISIDYLGFSSLARTLRNIFLSIPYLIKYTKSNKNNVFNIPIGYTGRPKDGDIKRVDKREIDVFFAGTVKRKNEVRGIIKSLVAPPKVISRNRMKKEVKKLNKKEDIKLYTKFGNSRDEKPLQRDEYMKKMRNSKICLSPRGNNIETWRLFEAAKSGCIVLSKKLPKRWYYNKCPIIQINDWREVNKKILKLLRNEKNMLERQKRTIEWYRNSCSPNALGKFMAEKISREIIQN